MKLLYCGLGALGWWAGAAIFGLAVNWDDRLTPALAGAWTLSIAVVALLIWRRARRLRGE